MDYEDNKITVIILTHNESMHILRAIKSAKQIANEIVVVDSFSTDDTAQLAEGAGATVIYHKFENQAKQFNWALEQLPECTNWVFRLDADEIISDDLSKSVQIALVNPNANLVGFNVNRRIAFLRRPIKFGGIFPIQSLRLFKFGFGRCEDRWMDEHIVVEGEVAELSGELLDDSLKSLSEWVDKHNRYASREVVDILNKRYSIFPSGNQSFSDVQGQAGTKRWIKNNLYEKAPIGVRALAYVIYRLVFRLGFLDGIQGCAFHVLQGFWYRFLVDMKLYEVEQYIKSENVEPERAIRHLLGLKF